jgi:hypothetical protein
MKLVHGDWCLCFCSEEFFYLPASDALQRISGSPNVIWIVDFYILHALNVLLRIGRLTFVQYFYLIFPKVSVDQIGESPHVYRELSVLIVRNSCMFLHLMLCKGLVDPPMLN